MSDSYRIPHIEYSEIHFATITVSVYLPDGRRAISAFKLDNAQLYEVGRKPRLEDYEMKYKDDGYCLYATDMNSWHRKADSLARAIGDRIAGQFIKALEQDPK